MALKFFDGFDTYASVTTDMIAAGWTSATIGSISSSGRFAGSRCVDIGASNNFLRYPFPASSDTITVGFAIKYTNNPSATGDDVALLENAGATIVRIGIDLNGALRIGRGDFTTNLISQSANSLLIKNNWHFLEVEIVRNASTGQVRAWIDGAQVINDTGKNTGASALTTLAFRRGLDSTLYDDFYYGDAATDHLGDCRVETLCPNADTAQADWTQSTGGTHFGVVDEQPQNGDTDYVSDATVGHKDLYDCTNMGSTPSTVHAVMTEMVARKDDATVRAVRNNLKSGATTGNGATRTLSTSYAFYKDLYLTDPNTAAAWTAANVNAAQVGPEVVT
jgi:hypothetical protein